MDSGWTSLLLLFLNLFVNSSSSVEACGERRSLNRIVGGRDSGGYHYPWFALLVLKENEDFPVCAGSLITPRHVLTAAHCFTIKPSTPNEDLFTVLMGVYDRCNRGEPDRQSFDVSRVDVHEEYLPGEKFHDIALITLNRPADYTLICLPTGKRDATEPALLIGFGVTKEGGRRAPCHMMEAHVTKYSKRDCKRTELPEEDIAEASVFCAGNVRGGVDSCQGDSGGPLQTVTEDGRFILAGVVSYGYGCANRGLPGLYTDVSSYLNWINSKISRETPVNDSHDTSEIPNAKRREFSEADVGIPAAYTFRAVRFPSDSDSRSAPDKVEWSTAPTVNFPKNHE